MFRPDKEQRWNDDDFNADDPDDDGMEVYEIEAPYKSDGFEFLITFRGWMGVVMCCTLAVAAVAGVVLVRIWH